ncbi:MAG: hypothetical protein HWN65_00650 [Candidatus Helarchaeota archaeon]|nr:hypothetical protein [Candidatus Helarchaeota archaeon]
MSEEKPSEEELKKMIDKAKETAEKKRKEYATKVGDLKTSDEDKEVITKHLEKHREKE